MRALWDAHAGAVEDLQTPAPLQGRRTGQTVPHVELTL